MPNKIKSVSILTAGEAKGHDLLIDQTSLQQALAVANTMGRIKVTNGHGVKQVMDILGFIDTFRIEGDRLMGDLTLFNTNEAQFVQHLAEVLPEGFGLSLTFSGVPEEKEGNRFARVTEIYDISVVSTPAANPAGIFSAFTAVDIKKLQMNEAPAEVKKELSEPAVVAPVAPVWAAAFCRIPKPARHFFRRSSGTRNSSRRLPSSKTYGNTLACSGVRDSSGISSALSPRFALMSSQLLRLLVSSFTRSSGPLSSL